jgi:transcriptional regulator with XRE-family HTH domain
MNAMDRCRKRIALWLDERSTAGKIKQKTFARHMGKSEAWLANILSGKRGLRLIDLDAVAEFFRVPVSELVRDFDNDLLEVTPSERALLKKIRRVDPEYRETILRVAGMAIPKPLQTELKTGHRKR